MIVEWPNHQRNGVTNHWNTSPRSLGIINWRMVLWSTSKHLLQCHPLIFMAIFAVYTIRYVFSKCPNAIDFRSKIPSIRFFFTSWITLSKFSCYSPLHFVSTFFCHSHKNNNGREIKAKKHHSFGGESFHLFIHSDLCEYTFQWLSVYVFVDLCIILMRLGSK